MDINQERRDEVLSFLKQHDKSYTQIGNLIHAERAFFVFSVYTWICEQKESGEMVEETVQFYLELINRYLRDEVELAWSPEGNLDIVAL
jgi:hypothetical protein